MHILCWVLFLLYPFLGRQNIRKNNWESYDHPYDSSHLFLNMFKVPKKRIKNWTDFLSCRNNSRATFYMQIVPTVLFNRRSYFRWGYGVRSKGWWEFISFFACIFKLNFPIINSAVPSIQQDSYACSSPQTHVICEREVVPLRERFIGNWGMVDLGEKYSLSDCNCLPKWPFLGRDFFCNKRRQPWQKQVFRGTCWS